MSSGNDAIIEMGAKSRTVSYESLRYTTELIVMAPVAPSRSV